MPTGYTAAIADGITFEQFALNCARAFGACITLRDDTGGGEIIPERFEPSDYHAKRLAEARVTLTELEAMSLEAAEKHCVETYLGAEESRIKRLLENKNQLAAYAAMLEQAKAWVPPSEDHLGLHEFMQTQIEESIKFDDSTEYYSKPNVKQSPEDWLESKKAEALKDIEYHKDEYANEVERTERRNEWVRLLRDSLLAIELVGDGEVE